MLLEEGRLSALGRLFHSAVNERLAIEWSSLARRRFLHTCSLAMNLFIGRRALAQMGILLWRSILRELLHERAPSLLSALLLGDLGSQSEARAQGPLDLERGQTGDVLGD